MIWLYHDLRIDLIMLSEMAIFCFHLAGSDRIVFAGRYLRTISIHAPLAGSDTGAAYCLRFSARINLAYFSPLLASEYHSRQN